MIRGTTPDYILKLNDYDLTDKQVYVTVKQFDKAITKTNDSLEIDVDDSGETTISTILMSLSQEETLSFSDGAAAVQVKIIDSDGHVDATKTASIQIDKALLEKVIDYDPAGSQS